MNRGPSHKKAEKSSKFKGVCWDRGRKKWVAEIGKDGKRYRIGRFTDEVFAAQAYNCIAYELYGEYAYQNPV